MGLQSQLHMLQLIEQAGHRKPLSRGQCQVTVINFTVTLLGLEANAEIQLFFLRLHTCKEQLVAEVVGNERPDLASAWPVSCRTQLEWPGSVLWYIWQAAAPRACRSNCSRQENPGLGNLVSRSCKQSFCKFEVSLRSPMRST